MILGPLKLEVCSDYFHILLPVLQRVSEAERMAENMSALVVSNRRWLVLDTLSAARASPRYVASVPTFLEYLTRNFESR